MKTKTTGHTEENLTVHKNCVTPIGKMHVIKTNDTDWTVAVIMDTNTQDGANAAELVRRWNAEPELRKALENIADSLGHLKPSDSGTVTPAAVERCARAALAKGQP